MDADLTSDPSKNPPQSSTDLSAEEAKKAAVLIQVRSSTPDRTYQRLTRLRKPTGDTVLGGNSTALALMPRPGGMRSVFSGIQTTTGTEIRPTGGSRCSFQRANDTSSSSRGRRWR